MKHECSVVYYEAGDSRMNATLRVFKEAMWTHLC